MNDAPRADPRTPEGKLTQTPIRDTVSMRATLLGPRIEDFSMAVRLFRVVMVDLGSVDPASRPAMNKGKCPFIAVVGVDGKTARVLGPGICTKQQILDGMKIALKPKLDLDKYLEKERKIVKDYVKRDALAADIGVKRQLQSEAATIGSGAASKLGDTLSKAENELARQDAELAKMEAEVAKLLEASGLKLNS